MLKALLIDDELASTRSLEILLSQFCKEVEVVGTARSAEEGLLSVSKLTPDVVFLDIEMPGGTGFDFLEKCQELNFEVVFITAHDSYAVKAFKYSAIDFILKPIEIDELIKAVDKVLELKKRNYDNRNKYNALFENLKTIIPNKLVVTVNGKYEYIDLRSVIFFENSNDNTLVKFSSKHSIFINESLDSLEEQLDEKNFYQINQTQMVNLEMVKKVEKTNYGIVVLNNDDILTLDSSRKEGLISRLMKLNKTL
ncbi:MAG: LytR/AlgR family response regulator transcription factor [Tenuifilaceae bacterium]